MFTVFNREPFTPWKIVLVDRYIDKTMEEIDADEDYSWQEFDCFYRTTFKYGKECELFTMVLKDTDKTMLQLIIFKNGDVKVWSDMPNEVCIYKAKKRIEILPLVHCKINKKRQVVEFSPIDGYN